MNYKSSWYNIDLFEFIPVICTERLGCANGGGLIHVNVILNLSHCKYWRTLKCSKCLQKHNTLFDSVVNLANKHWSLFSLWAVLVVATFKWPVANIQ